MVAPGMDLAILEVERPSFFDDHPPLPVADEIPAMKQTLNVYGFPIGGEQMSVTQGIVSRIEYTNITSWSRVSGSQFNAALNPGNSGGPGVSDGKIVGLVYGKNERGENIGYLIAAEEIRMFLKDIHDGVYHGKANSGTTSGPRRTKRCEPSSGWASSRGRWSTRSIATPRIIRSRNGTSSRASATTGWTARATRRSGTTCGFRSSTLCPSWPAAAACAADRARRQAPRSRRPVRGPTATS